MFMKKQDDIFKELAARYTEIDSEMLKEQYRKIEKDDTINTSPQLDIRVHQNISKKKTRTYITKVCQLAAGLLILMLAGYTMNHITIGTSKNSGMDKSESRIQSPGDGEQDYHSDMSDSISGTQNANADTQVAGKSLETSNEDTDDAAKDDIIPLEAALPDNFSITNIVQDGSETIYNIADTNNDGVILTICKSDGTMDIDGFEQININQTPAYVLEEDDYILLKFEKDGCLYSLTCKYNVNTLIQISESII